MKEKKDKIIIKREGDHIYVTPVFLLKEENKSCRANVRIDLDEALRKATSKKSSSNGDGGGGGGGGNDDDSDDRFLERDMDKEKPYTGKRNHSNKDDIER